MIPVGRPAARHVTYSITNTGGGGLGLNNMIPVGRPAARHVTYSITYEHGNDFGFYSAVEPDSRIAILRQ